MSAAMSGQNHAGDRNMTRAMQTYTLTKPPPTGTTQLQPPVMSSATGLGAGGGVAVDGRSDASYGHLRVFVGLAPSATGVIVVSWSTLPQPTQWTCDWATLVVAGTTPTTITWTALNPLVTSSRPLRIDWRWTVPV